MICQYNLLFLFLCVFVALSVSTKECGDNLAGDSCILKLPEQFNKAQNSIEWTHSSSNLTIKRKPDKDPSKRGTSCFIMETDGSLKCLQLTLKDTGNYTYTVHDGDGIQTGRAVKTINVYEKAPKLKVTVKCTSDGNATLSCDIGNRKDLTVSWFKEKTLIPNAKTPQVFLSSIQVQEYKAYSCKAHNPVSTEQSESLIVSCPGQGFGWRKLFGFDFWIMVSILAGGGSLLLLLICVLIICACRSCRQRSKRQLDEEELRLADLTPGHTGTNRSKQTARGQPVPPIPLEDPKPCAPSPHTPPQTQTQPKAQSRVRPPPQPQDDDEDCPPPLPRPRNKQHRTKRNQEPYRPME